MPEWQADAIIISVRPHGEGNAVVSLLTADYGRHAGLVRGGASKKMRGTVQPGNRVQASWRARLSEQLGQMQLELTQAVAARFLDSPMRLAGVASVCALLEGALPEREPNERLYAGTDALLSVISMDDDDEGWLEGYVRWELGLLHAAGYQLDLDRCAASGETTNLAYVSPKSGGAVSRHHAGQFANRLLALPGFLGGVACPSHDWVAGLDLTGHFLAKRVFAAHNADIPAARRRLADIVETRYKQAVDNQEAVR
ncbi:MAG: DNA repair protein RecO [Alphaproteobacteria bacterium]|jgi:DNA repair protein RecO (recombination protein O)|nr:DNA repair protein RecO [Pseudomonadota bacterium]